MRHKPLQQAVSDRKNCEILAGNAFLSLKEFRLVDVAVHDFVNLSRCGACKMLFRRYISFVLFFKEVFLDGKKKQYQLDSL